MRALRLLTACQGAALRGGAAAAAGAPGSRASSGPLAAAAASAVRAVSEFRAGDHQGPDPVYDFHYPNVREQQKQSGAPYVDQIAGDPARSPGAPQVLGDDTETPGLNVSQHALGEMDSTQTSAVPGSHTFTERLGIGQGPPKGACSHDYPMSRVKGEFTWVEQEPPESTGGMPYE